MQGRDRFVVRPSVTAFAANQMLPEGLQAWLDSEGLEEVAVNGDTPLAKIVSDPTPDRIPEFAGRFCYESWEKGRGLPEYMENIKESGHGSVLEHGVISVAISGVSRSLTHELVRHRAGFAISQQSQRFVDMKKSRFVVPPILLYLWGNVDCTEAKEWMDDKLHALEAYEAQQTYITEALLEEGRSKARVRKLANEAARAELPNATETKLVWTGNFRGLRHVLDIRGSAEADLEIKRLQIALLTEVSRIAPEVFHDIELAEITDDDFGIPSIEVRYKKV